MARKRKKRSGGMFENVVLTGEQRRIFTIIIVALCVGLAWVVASAVMNYVGNQEQPTPDETAIIESSATSDDDAPSTSESASTATSAPVVVRNSGSSSTGSSASSASTTNETSSSTESSTEDEGGWDEEEVAAVINQPVDTPEKAAESAFAQVYGGDLTFTIEDATTAEGMTVATGTYKSDGVTEGLPETGTFEVTYGNNGELLAFTLDGQDVPL